MHGKRLVFVGTPTQWLLSHHRKTLDLQIRVRGLVSLCPTEENDRHWQQRPRGSQLSAVASSQSEEIESYEDMMELKKQAEEHFRDMEQVPRPPHWGGYRVTPVEMEFWQGMPNRMHRRHVFRFEGEAEGGFVWRLICEVERCRRAGILWCGPTNPDESYLFLLLLCFIFISLDNFKKLPIQQTSFKCMEKKWI